MTCRLCDRRTARRACPAVHADICTVCCGTKRQRDIACPADCQYLLAAQQHPAAVVRKQQEEDLRMFLPTVRDLSPSQEEVLSALLFFLRGYRGDALMPTTDDDLQTAAAALAATYETASRGVIYEERPASLPARRLVAALQPLLAELPQKGAVRDADMAVAFRAIERGARDARKTLPGGTSAYLSLLTRLIVRGEPKASQQETVTSPLMQPGGSLIVRP